MPHAPCSEANSGHTHTHALCKYCRKQLEVSAMLLCLLGFSGYLGNPIASDKVDVRFALFCSRRDFQQRPFSGMAMW